MVRRRAPAPGARWQPIRLLQAIDLEGGAIKLIDTVFTWIFFRATSLSDAFLICGRIFHAAWTNPWVPAMMLVLVFVVWIYQFMLESPLRTVLKMGFMRVSLVVAMFLYICLCSSGAGSFIYFQF